MSVVTLFGRRDCHLCDEARDRLLGLRDEFGFELREVDIDGDDRLHARYLERIPVVAVNGELVCELEVDEPALRAALGGRLGTLRQ